MCQLAQFRNEKVENTILTIIRSFCIEDSLNTKKNIKLPNPDPPLIDQAQVNRWAILKGPEIVNQEENIKYKFHQSSLRNNYGSCYYVILDPQFPLLWFRWKKYNLRNNNLVTNIKLTFSLKLNNRDNLWKYQQQLTTP